MALKEVVIIGGGYGCQEVLAIINSINEKGLPLKVLGILDDDPNLFNCFIGDKKVLGGLKDWLMFDDKVNFILAIGTYSNLELRKKIIDFLQIPVERFVKLIDPRAIILIEQDEIGYGCIIHSNVIIHPLSKIGNFVVISASTVIGVANIVIDYALLAAGIVTATNITFGACSFVGSGAVIAPNVQIGCKSLVALGSVVFKDIEHGHKVIGNPAKSFEKSEVSVDLIHFHKDKLNYYKKNLQY
jgi:sugar O-acyltransferase (sialic acid O-acetyltransferase NeuD family)